MKNFRYFAQRYVDWVIRLGRVRFSLLGIAILAILAICIQILLSTLLSDGIHSVSYTHLYLSEFLW